MFTVKHMQEVLSSLEKPPFCDLEVESIRLALAAACLETEAWWFIQWWCDAPGRAARGIQCCPTRGYSNGDTWHTPGWLAYLTEGGVRVPGSDCTAPTRYDALIKAGAWCEMELAK